MVEPWLTPQQWRKRSVHANFVDQPELKIARMNISETKGKLSFMDMHHLVATPKRVESTMAEAIGSRQFRRPT